MTKHKALVAVELEVLAKKFDRFGWERDRGSAAQDRIIMDWIEALVDFPINEIRDACRTVVLDDPSRMPNEGHVLKRIIARRAEVRRRVPHHITQDRRQEPDEGRAAFANRIMSEVFGGKRMGGEA